MKPSNSISPALCRPGAPPIPQPASPPTAAPDHSPGMACQKRPFSARSFLCAMLAVMLVLLSLPAYASLTLTASYQRDTFVIFESSETGLAGRNGREIAAPTASQPRTEEVMIGFDLSSIKTQFDAYYGVGGWVVSSVSLTLGSNYPTAGVQPNNSRFNMINSGLFTLNWLSNDSWDAASLMYYDLYKYLPGYGSNTMETLGTYYYFADGTPTLTWVLANTPGLVADILSGSLVTIFGAPADSTIGYLFNPGEVLTITADAASVPIPAAVWLLGSGMAGLVGIRRRMSKKA